MDNRIFNVNGPLHTNHQREKDVEQLAATLDLAMRQRGENTKAVGWSVLPDVGLVFYWTEPANIAEPFNRFLAPMGRGDSQPLAHMAAQWLDTDEAKAMKHAGFDAEYIGDGDCGDGWRVSVGDWGHVGGRWEAICAVRHAFMWYGK